MATYNLFLNASQADSAITNSYRLFQPNGLTGQSISLYGGNINNRGTINSTQLYITGGIGEESFINRLTGGIRVAGNSEFDTIVNGVDILGTSYIQTLTGGLNVTNGGFNVVGDSVNNGSFRNVGSVSITGPTAITGTTRIIGNTTIVGNITQTGNFQASQASVGTLTVTSGFSANGRISSAGLTSTAGLTVTGLTSIIGNSTLQGVTNIVGSLQLNGQPFVTQAINNITENKYFLTGGECLTQLNAAGGVIQTDQTGLIARYQGPVVGQNRGQFSVDLQLVRSAGDRVSAGDNSALIAGAENKAFGRYSAIIGGLANSASGNFSAIIGGQGNQANSRAGFTPTYGGSFVVGGFRNHASGESCAILAGTTNTGMAPNCAVIGGENNFNESPNCTIIGGVGGLISANRSVLRTIGLEERYIKNSTILGGEGGVVYNPNEIVLSNSFGWDLGPAAQSSQIVLGLMGRFYSNGRRPDPTLGYTPYYSIHIPVGYTVFFKGVGGMRNTIGQSSVVEIRGSANYDEVNSIGYLNLETSYFGNLRSNITGEVSSAGLEGGAYFSFFEPPTGSSPISHFYSEPTIGTGSAVINLQLIYVPKYGLFT
jgi:hypothetical protein